MNAQNVTVFMYDFGGTAPPFYASHAAELPFVFDYDDGTVLRIKYMLMLAVSVASL